MLDAYLLLLPEDSVILPKNSKELNVNVKPVYFSVYGKLSPLGQEKKDGVLFLNF